MRIKHREAERLVSKLRFECTGKRHHKMYILTHGGVPVLKTRVSHGHGDMAATDKFRGQLKLNLDEFRAALECTLDFAAYVEVLRRKGIIEE